MEKKHIIKIPKNVIVVYSRGEKKLYLVGPLGSRSLVLKLEINVVTSPRAIEITPNSFYSMSNYEKKKIRSVQGTTTAVIKHLLLEILSVVYQRLRLVGVGYKASKLENYGNNLLMFKLGYSHLLYFKIPYKLGVFSLKFTKLFIFGNSYQNVTQIASIIRSYKIPEPYKGKGILYVSEKISLKEGKKV